WYILGNEVEAFEAEFAAWTGATAGVGVASGTDAVAIALLACGVGPGDAVFTVSHTAVATVAAIVSTGAVPVLVDVDADTFTMSVDSLHDALDLVRGAHPQLRPAAVALVHLYGRPGPVAQVIDLCSSAGLRLIEDSAQAHGASIDGVPVGSFGDAAAFSFYPTKNLGGYGDGGMVVTDSDELAETMRRRRIYGMINKDEFVEDGINSRLDEVQAAVLRVKLRHLDAMNRRRCELDALYRRLLPPQVQPQAVRPGVESVYHVYSLRCDDRRDELVAALERDQIQTNVYYPMPLPRQAAYRKVYGEHRPLPVAEEVCRRVIALPFYPELPEETVRLVADRVTRFYRG
ncbi:MAG: DegT/DnrJ/EryC1/StrS family aminotransferase, partial [Candidatus Latescibacterota bacterium]